MSIQDLIVGVMAAVAQHTGCAVALYVQDEMTCTGADGVVRFLPVIAVERGGYDPIPDSQREQVSQHFGSLLAVAELRVEQINRMCGLEPGDALALVDRSMQASTR